MLSFRQKILISYLLIFFVFISLIFPITAKWIHHIVITALNEQATNIIAQIQTASDNNAIIHRLKEQKGPLFVRVSVITNDLQVLYDTHTKRFLGPTFSQEYRVSHPEVLQAFREGIGYHEEYSNLLGQKFAYFAKMFNFHGKTYVVRTAFPYHYVAELRYDFEVGFITLAILILLLFSIMSWVIIHFLTKPITQIIQAVRPYQEGLQAELPVIDPLAFSPRDDFGKLAYTLNSLSLKIQNQINTLTNERNEKETILESLVEGVIAVDMNMVITYANQMALRFLNLEMASIIGLPFEAIRQETCQSILEQCKEEGIPKTDHLIVEKEGHKVYFDVVATPTKDNSGAILVLQDKSAHHKLLGMRKDFIANASHELKTPITIIRGFAETIHDNPTLPQEIMIDVTGKIVRNCQRMATLIKDLLILSDVENIPSTYLSSVNLKEFMEKCRASLLHVFPEAQIQIEAPEEDVYLTAEISLLELAVMNLFENAAKYSPKPARIQITISQQAEYIIIAVADQGIGIPVEDQEQIFERFYTVDKAHSQKMGGSGLGLSIVKTIVEKHGGTISLMSTPGKGSTFTMIFPK
jgi:two-component system, OmpR family, phosphate regulon sensor histidine kinase PhoR